MGAFAIVLPALVLLNAADLLSDEPDASGRSRLVALSGLAAVVLAVALGFISA